LNRRICDILNWCVQFNANLEGPFKDSGLRVTIKSANRHAQSETQPPPFLCTETALWADYKAVQHDILERYCTSGERLKTFKYYQYYTDCLRNTIWCSQHRPMALYLELFFADVGSNAMAEGQGHSGNVCRPAHQKTKSMIQLECEMEVKDGGVAIGFEEEIIRVGEKFWRASGHFDAESFDATKCQFVAMEHVRQQMAQADEPWRGDAVEMREATTEHKQRIAKQKHRNKQFKDMTAGLGAKLAELKLGANGPNEHGGGGGANEANH
jgi:hypothetical protein